MELENYIKEFLSNIKAEASAQGNFLSYVFLEQSLDMLVDIGTINDYQITEYYNKNKGFRVDGWVYDEERNLLNLVVNEFVNDSEIININQSSLIKSIERATKFYTECLNNNKFKDSLEDSDPIVSLAWKINDLSKVQHSIKVIFLTNKKISSRTKELKIKNCLVDVWDIERFHGFEKSGQSKEAIEVDFSQFGSDGIPFLKSNSSDDDISSYLLIFEGEVLAKIYEQFGERLLEQNVRTFLQNRGKVNKGMRITINEDPHRFFSYNNGITATAESVEINDNKITKIKNFQIVNGGQTTASIYSSYSQDKADLSSVSVQGKLSIISPTRIETIVPKISKYANTQNKVSETDFFSNHPYHVRIEELSRRVLAPPSPNGSLGDTIWFYERTRGQYANAQFRLTPLKKKAFIKKHPRNQFFDKTLLAKVISTFDCKPDDVSRGAQYNFKNYANSINERWNKNDAFFNETYYKNSISKIILFKSLDLQIYRHLGGAYKAQILTYTLSKICHELEKLKLSFPYQRIWSNQYPGDEILNKLLSQAKLVRDFLESTGIKANKDIAQWCKLKDCWNQLKEHNLKLSKEFLNQMVSAYELKKENKRDILKQIDINKIDKVSYVYKKGQAHWLELLEWNEKAMILLEYEISILNLAASNKVLSDKQALKLINAENRAKEHGFPKLFL
jgi:hypothetical protein